MNLQAFMLFWVFVLSKAVSRVVMDIFITLNLKGSAITPQIGGSLAAIEPPIHKCEGF